MNPWFVFGVWGGTEATVQITTRFSLIGVSQERHTIVGASQQKISLIGTSQERITVVGSNG